jgi:hypothetical protein
VFTQVAAGWCLGCVGNQLKIHLLEKSIKIINVTLKAQIVRSLMMVITPKHVGAVLM